MLEDRNVNLYFRMFWYNIIGINIIKNVQIYGKLFFPDESFMQIMGQGTSQMGSKTVSTTCMFHSLCLASTIIRCICDEIRGVLATFSSIVDFSIYSTN